MVNRPKSIGTAAETAIVRAARTHGFPAADRLTLTGSQDRGDIGLCPGVIIEAKGGETARKASDGLIETWLQETETERAHAKAVIGFLVTQRRGVGAPNAHRWWAWWRLGWVTDLCGSLPPPNPRDTPIRMLLADAFTLLRTAGWGEPLDTQGNRRENVPGVRYAHGVAVSRVLRGSGATNTGVPLQDSTLAVLDPQTGTHDLTED